MTTNKIITILLIVFALLCKTQVQGQKHTDKTKTQADSNRVLLLNQMALDLKMKQDSIVVLMANIANDTLNSDSLRVFAMQYLVRTGNSLALKILLKDISAEFPLQTYDEYMSYLQRPNYSALSNYSKQNNIWQFLSVVFDYAKSDTLSDEDALHIAGILHRTLTTDVCKIILYESSKYERGLYGDNLRKILSKFK